MINLFFFVVKCVRLTLVY